MNKFFGEIKRNFGFGCMRLPMKDGEVDDVEFTKMVDKFLESGFNYFDTAHGYLQGKSEKAIKRCLTSRYPRDKYILTDKLSGYLFDKEEEILPMFQDELDACGVEYFDFFLMHSQDKATFEKFKKVHAYEHAKELKEQGKVRHVGLSFHDTADVLDEILTTYPFVEVVQLQFNYVDYESDDVQSRKCYEVAKKHGKPVIVMEPVRGGALVDLPSDAQKILDGLGGGSNASYAIRFAASHDNIMMVLSGMGSMEMMNDNVSFMQDFKPLSDEERSAVLKVAEVLKTHIEIPCTGCKYCATGCPKGILIPEWFSVVNKRKAFGEWYEDYDKLKKGDGGKPNDCISCGHCESVCPQHIDIRKRLSDITAEYRLK